MLGYAPENNKDTVPGLLEFISTKMLGRKNWASQRTTERSRWLEDSE